MKMKQGKAQVRSRRSQEAKVEIAESWLSGRWIPMKVERKKTPKPRREVDPSIDTQLLADLFPMPKE